MPSKMKKAHKSIASDASLARKEEHVSSEIKGKLGSGKINGKGHPKLKMPCLTKAAQDSGKKKENLAKKDKHVSSEIKGKLGSGGINSKGHSKLKMACLTKKTQLSGNKKENLDKKDKHVSSEIKGKLGNRSGGEGDCNAKTLPKINKRCESGKSPGSLVRKEEHVPLKNECRIGNRRSNYEGEPHLMELSKKKKQPRSRKKNQSLDNKDKHGSSEKDEKKKQFRQKKKNQSYPNLKMPFMMKESHKFLMPLLSQSSNDQCRITPIVSPWSEATTYETIPFNNQYGITQTISHRVGAATTCTTYKQTTQKKIQESGKRTENLHKKDKHVSSENNCGLGNSGSGGEGDCNLKTISNRKKICESGKSNGSLDRREEHVSSKNEGRLSNSMDQDHAWINPKKSVGCGTPGRCIGKLFVSNTEIAKGSSGTVILEGSYEHRSVAVKRIARAHYHIASQEIQSLSASDGDPNIVRLYGAEQDQDFVYLALERCACSLDDLIRAHSKSSGKSVFPHDPASNAIDKYKMHLGSVEGTMQDVSLWREDGHPSSSLLKLMRGVVSGLVHLHRSGIIHRGLKPQNILITKELCAKLSDMGISRLPPGDSSSSDHVAGKESTAKILREVKENGLPSPDGGIFVALDTQHLYKSQLQTFAQKRSLALPIYCSEHEGPPEACRFRCKVSIDGRTYETLEFYNTSKEAEHAAARIALMSLSPDTFHEVDCGLYKNLLQEFTHKQGHCRPVYETVRCDESQLPFFFSTVKIQGESFTGKEARTKKMAESTAAKVAYTILKERTSDAFDLGCVLFFCVTGGRNPFGDSLKGESNTEENTIDLSPVEFMPEAADLFLRLLNQDSKLRPKTSEVFHHPLFWNSKTRLSFLRDISDWVKSKAWGTNSDALEKLESIAQRVFDEEWKEMIDCEFMKHARKFRAYEFKRVEDLLRIVRNTFSHYRELPPEIQEIVGSSPEDLDSYFTKRFPRLLIETYRFVSTSCKDGESSPFPEYFDS